ncbi:MAG: bifunctional diguanylate cyclase/phosphodiesterase, partial [Eubacterium sp.]|nr:bifunctional diguanylate cyclase/phosphodiesterase [Eubacterium sp.]
MQNEMKKEDIIQESHQKTDEGKWELYLYSLRKMAEENVEKHRYSLTNLHDLQAFFYICGEMILEHPDWQYGVIVMDIDQFKAVNEFCGRKEGDRMLKHIAQCFEQYETIRPNTHVCHIRADIFCMCTTYEKLEELVDIVEGLRQNIEALPFAYKVLTSFGIATSNESNPAISYMKDCATIALNSIKGKFFARYAFFDDEMRRKMLREKQVENDIVAALENEELTFYVQPKVNMRTGEIVGGEALVRWIHPEKGMISPGEFIPVLEKNGFIINVDQYVWKRVFEYLAGLDKEGRKKVPISINISRVHAYDPDLCDTLLKFKKEYQIDAEYVPLELTESAFLADEKGMYERMEILRSGGFFVSMDDFGTGYSTMNMLKNQPVDEIKIDRALITDLENKKSRIIIHHTLAMLKELETDIIVEGVETAQQKDFLLECGC